MTEGRLLCGSVGPCQCETEATSASQASPPEAPSTTEGVRPISSVGAEGGEGVAEASARMGRRWGDGVGDGRAGDGRAGVGRVSDGRREERRSGRCATASLFRVLDEQEQYEKKRARFLSYLFALLAKAP